MNLQSLQSLAIKINGWFRLFFLGNFCPECNSDAPEKDTCIVCNNMDYWDVRKSKPFLWERFKNRKELIEKKNHDDLMKVLRERQPVKPPSKFA